MTKKAIAIFLLTSVCATFQALAQTQTTNPPTAADLVERRVNGLTRLLTLTTAQQQQATTIFTNSITAETSIRDNLRTARQSLSETIKTNAGSTIDQVATTIGSLTSQQTSIEAKADAAFYLILTPDQQTKLNSSRGGFGVGPGGFGPDGFGRGPRPAVR